MPAELKSVIEDGKIVLGHADEINISDPPGGNGNQFMVYVSFSETDIQGFVVPFAEVVDEAVSTCVEWAESRDEILRLATSLEAGAKAMLAASSRLRTVAATAEEELAD